MGMKHTAWAREHSRAQGAAHAVLTQLAGAANDDGDECFPSIPTLAYWSRVDERTVYRAIKELEEMGEIRCDKRLGRATHYILLMPEGVTHSQGWQTVRGDRQSGATHSQGRHTVRGDRQSPLTHSHKTPDTVSPIKYLKKKKGKTDISSHSEVVFDAQNNADYIQPTATWVAPSDDAAKFWEEVKAELKMQLPTGTFAENVRDAVWVRYDGDKLTIAGANVFAVDFLQGRLTPVIERAMEALAGRHVTLEVIEKQNAERAFVPGRNH